MQLFLLINNFKNYNYQFDKFIFTNTAFYVKLHNILTKKATGPDSPVAFLYKTQLFFVLNGKFLNKLALYITRNEFVCRRRHDERSTTTGE